MKALAHVILRQLLFALWLAAMWVLYCTPACTHPIEHLIAAPFAVLIPTARRAIIWRTKHDKRTFTGKVDFVTARGNVSDIVTPLCVFTMHEGELILKSVHPTSSIEEVPAPPSAIFPSSRRRPPRRRSCAPCARSTPWITGASSSDDCSFGNDKK